jgi:S-formylglutathione hydrolase FrmB
MFALAAGLPAPALAQRRTSDQERQQQAAFVNSMGGV